MGDLSMPVVSTENELFSCETCSERKRNVSPKYSIKGTRFDSNFFVCREGHQLFPQKCDNCQSSWEGFVKDKNRILCLHCDYPVHVFDRTAQKCEEAADCKFFEEAPNSLICTCCHAFEFDLFLLLPIDDQHIYFQCICCSLEMIVQPRCMLRGSNSRNSASSLSIGCNNSESIHDIVNDDTFLAAHIQEKEFLKVLKVAKSRLECLQDKYVEVSTELGLEGTKANHGHRRHPRNISKVINKLLMDERFHKVSKQVLQKTPMVASTLIGLLATATTKNPKAGEIIGLGCFVLLEAISEILLAELESRYIVSRECFKV